MREIALESTSNFKFSTRQFSSGASFALASGAVAAYPGSSTTQITAGITLSADFDTVTGLNNVEVVATAANGYAANTEYALVLTAGTVDSVSVVGQVVAEFRTTGVPAAAGAEMDLVDAPNSTAITAIQNGLATPTNITAGTITTVTNLTNAPTNGDLTATMKASVNAEVDTALADYDGPTNAEMEARTLVAAEYATATALAVVDQNVDDIEVAVNALNNLSPAEVNAEVEDVLLVDTQTLPGQVAPTVTPTLGQAILFNYKGFRNRSDQDATTWQLYADDGTTVDQKATVSDSGTLFVRGEVASGP